MAFPIIRLIYYFITTVLTHTATWHVPSFQGAINHETFTLKIRQENGEEDIEIIAAEKNIILRYFNIYCEIIFFVGAKLNGLMTFDMFVDT